MSANHRHHSFDYIEIPSLNIDASEAFYRAAFGWTFNSYGPEYLGIVMPDGTEGGGIARTGAISAGDGALVVLFSDDIEGTRDAVVAAGGRIVRDIFTFSGGRRFHFADPSGIELAVWGDPTD